jgi:hypothetical protein
VFYGSPLGVMYPSKERLKIGSSRGFEEHLKDQCWTSLFQKFLDPPMYGVQQWGFFYVLRLLRHGTLVYMVSSKGPAPRVTVGLVSAMKDHQISGCFTDFSWPVRANLYFTLKTSYLRQECDTNMDMISKCLCKLFLKKTHNKQTNFQQIQTTNVLKIWK